MNSTGLQIQQGGKQIAEGAFGCIFSPPLQCLTKTKREGRPQKNRLGKLTGYDDIKSEIIAAKYLKQFSKTSKYCILPELETICKPDISSTEATTECHVVQDAPNNEYFQFNLEYGGDTLKHTLNKVNPSFKTVPFFSLMQKLLEMGSFLVIHGFIHNDIHGNNIVLGDTFTPRLIDFGRSYIHDKITPHVIDELVADYNPGLGQITPETSAEHGVRDGIPLTTILEDLWKKKPALEWGEKILGISRRAQIAEFKRFWLTSKAVQTQDWVAFYKMYWPVADSWAIGHNLLQLLRRMNVTEDFKGNEEWVARRSVVKQVLRGLLHTSPKLRLDCIQALAIYDPTNELVTSGSGSTWLEKKRQGLAREKV